MVKGTQEFESGSQEPSTGIFPDENPQLIDTQLSGESSATVQEGLEHHRSGDFKKAAEVYAQVIKNEPSNCDAHALLGAVSLKEGHFNDAEFLINKAIKICPGRHQFHYNLGAVYRKLSKFDDALQEYNRALEIKPDYGLAYGGLGDAYFALENYVDALLNYKEALTHCETPDILNGLGLVLTRFGKHDAAAEAYIKALKIDPDRHEIYSNLGELLRLQGKMEASVQAYSTALSLRPELDVIRWNRAFPRLMSGDVSGGWDDYEAGLRSFNRHPIDFGVERWGGETDLSEKCVAVGLEQGLGDELLFGTCYPDLHERAKTLILSCDPRLEKLWQRRFPDAWVLPVTKQERAKGTWELPSLYPRPEVQVAAGSLPSHFRRSLRDFNSAEPILFPDRGLAEKWQTRVGALPQGLKVGISWRSSHMTVRRSWNYLVEDSLLRLLDISGVKFVNLQYDATGEELSELSHQGGLTVFDWEDLDQFNDLEQVVALIGQLDLVISVPSAPSRLASATGQRCWRIEHQHFSSMGCDVHPFFNNTRLWRYGDFADTNELIDAMKEEIEQQILD